jgi:hypothetical protein
MGSNDAPVFDASPCGDADGCILCRTNPITGPIPVKKSYDATQLQVASRGCQGAVFPGEPQLCVWLPSNKSPLTRMALGMPNTNYETAAELHSVHRRRQR